MEGHENDIGALGQSNATPEVGGTTPPAPTSGGIFSSSDTRVETENLPEIPEVVQQAPMSSITPALRTTSTVTGDLKLGNAPKKRKWPFVVLGVVVVALIGIGIWLLRGTENNNKIGNIDEAFGYFANYYLFSEDSDRLLEGEWDRSRVYAAEEAILAKDKSFFQWAKNYFDQYKSFYDKQIAQQEDEIDPADASYIEAFTDAFNFLYLYSQTDFFDDSELLQLYVSSGAAAAYEVIEDRYSALLDTDYQLQKDFAEGRILYDSAQIDRLEIYSQSGCLKDDGSFVDDDGCKVNSSDFDMERINESYDVPDLSTIPQDVAHETTRMLYIMANQGLYK